MTRKLILVLLLIAACGERDLANIEWVEVTRGDLVVSAEVTGNLRAVNSKGLGPPPVPGVHNFKIASMAPEGKEVKKGEPVLGFDPTELQQTLELKNNERDSAAKELEQKSALAAMTIATQELEFAEARGRLRKAKLKAQTPGDLAKAIELAKAKLDYQLVQLEVSALQKKIADSKAQNAAELAVLRDVRDRATGRVEEIQKSLSSLRVPAPSDGTIIYVTNWRGDKKKVGEGAWKGQKVLEVAGLGDMEAEGAIDEVDFAKVKLDQPVRIKLDAHPDDEYTGRLSEISENLSTKSWSQPSKVARVKVKIDQSDPEKMRPGMRFRGEVETTRFADVLKIPKEAIFLGPKGAVTFRRTDDGFEQVSIEVGRRNAEEIEVLSGLEPGDKVSTAALEVLQ